MNFLTPQNTLSTLREEMGHVEQLLDNLDRSIKGKEGKPNDWLTRQPTYLEPEIRNTIAELVDMERWPLRAALAGRREVGMYAFLMQIQRLMSILIKLVHALDSSSIDPESSGADQVSFVQGLALQLQGHLKCAWSAARSMLRVEIKTIPAEPLGSTTIMHGVELDGDKADADQQDIKDYCDRLPPC